MKVWGSSLQRYKPLRAKKPWVKKHSPWNRTKKTDTKRTELKKVSRSQKRRLEEYKPIRLKFLKENPWCGICMARGFVPLKATEIHHMRGRSGRLLCDTRFFKSSCRSCREWPHEHAIEARAIGVLASPVDWGVFPSEK